MKTESGTGERRSHATREDHAIHTRVVHLVPPTLARSMIKEKVEKVDGHEQSIQNVPIKMAW